MIEKEESSFCEEPKIYYYSTSANFGVRSFFSERKKIPNNKYPNYFSPCSLHNNKFSVYNTIMLPHVNGECFLESDKTYSDKIKDKNSSENGQMKASSLQKDITMNKTECSNEEKNITYENQLKELLIGINNKTLPENTSIQKSNRNVEKNPYFLGNITKSKHSQNNVVLKKKSNLEIECENDDDFFKKGPSRSLICTRSNKKQSNAEDDDKSEINPKKNKKLSMKKEYFNFKFDNKKEKSIKDKSNRMRSRLSFHIKNIKFGRKEDNINKDDDIKIKKERFKNNEKRINNFYYSNKCVTNNFIINNFTPKNKKETDNKDNKSSEGKYNNKKNAEKKNLKKSQRLRNHRNDNITRNNKEENIKKNNIKSNKDENNNINKKILTNKIQAYIQEKELNSLKDKPKKKENNYDNKSKEKSFDLGKKKSENNINKNKRYNSKKEIKRVIINKDEEEKKKQKFKKQKITKGNSVEKKDIKNIKKSVQLKSNLDEEDNFSKEKMKGLSNRQIIQKEDIDINKKRKSLTVDVCKKKSCSNMKFKNSFNSFRKKIQEVPMTLFANDNRIKKQKKIDFEYALKKNIKKTQFNLFSKDKFTNTEFNDCDYLKYTLDCMDLILDINIEKQVRLKNKINFNFPKPKKSKNKKKIALFDLDETLIHCTGDINIKKEKYQHAIEIRLPGRQAVQVGINIRPYWKQTLNLIKKNYHIVIYTASHQAYADAVLDFMDPKKKYFKYRLYRNNCSLIDVDGAKFYVKDLDIFNENYDLKDIVIIDNSVLSFAYHLHNGIPIVPYYDEDKDGSLYVVGLYLMHIFNEDDLREANKKQINLDSFLEEAKKKKEEEYLEEDQIEEESVSKEDDLDNNNNDNNNSREVKKSSKKSCIKELKDYDKEKKYSIKHSSFKFLTKEDEENNDFAQKKLMSCSKLINMYYEVKDKSNNNENSEFNNISDNKKLEESTDKKNIIFVDSNDDNECKSQPGYSKKLIDFYENEIDDNGKETRLLKRLFTIIDDLSLNQKIKDGKFEKNICNIYYNNKKNNLGFIRSKFYNNFKI